MYCAVMNALFARLFVDPIHFIIILLPWIWATR